jgi:hypothetical protein
MIPSWAGSIVVCYNVVIDATLRPTLLPRFLNCDSSCVIQIYIIIVRTALFPPFLNSDSSCVIQIYRHTNIYMERKGGGVE